MDMDVANFHHYHHQVNLVTLTNRIVYKNGLTVLKVNREYIQGAYHYCLSSALDKLLGYYSLRF